jgi:hypothetical protein
MITKSSKTLLRILIILAVSLSSCQFSNNKFPTVVETFVSPASLPEPYKYYGFDYILSYDGKSIWLSSIEKFDLTSGKIDSTFIDDVRQNYQGNSGIQSTRNSFGWSVDERYLATTSHDVDIQNDVIHPFVYIIDTQEKTVTKIDDLESFSQWSPINDEIMFASSHQAHVWNRVNSSPIPQWQAKDFKQSSELVGNRDWLWDKEINLPIAYIDFKQETENAATGRFELGISSYDPPNKYTYWKSVLFLESNKKWGRAIFDPTGQYILISYGEPADTLNTQEQGNDIEIKDTVLLLINWETQETKELLRLSSLDPQNVIATDIAWSGDGSTILVLRKETSPLVLKIEYP